MALSSYGSGKRWPRPAENCLSAKCWMPHILVLTNVCMLYERAYGLFPGVKETGDTVVLSGDN